MPDLPLHNLELQTQRLLSVQSPALGESKQETQAAMRSHCIQEVCPTLVLPGINLVAFPVQASAC